MNKQTKTYSVQSIMLLVCYIMLTSATVPWVAPTDASLKVNPLQVLAKNVSVGKTIYTKSCQSCHGVKADGNGLMQSASLISPLFQKQTDGELFYKIATGKGQMPPFKGVLKDDEIWSLINYFRVLVNPSVLPPAKKVFLQLSCETKGRRKIVTAHVFEQIDTIRIPATDVDIHFYIARDFGLKQFGDAYNYTDVNGKVTVLFPDDIIGDANGSVNVIAKIEDNMMYKPVLDSSRQTWGKPLEGSTISSTDRSLFGARDKAPLWLLFLANGILAGVWAFIVWVVIILFKIKKLSNVFIK